MEIYALVEILEDWESSGQFQSRRPQVPKVPTSYRNTSRWYSVPSLRHRGRNMTVKPKVLKKKTFNYEGFDSDFY